MKLERQIQPTFASKLAIIVIPFLLQSAVTLFSDVTNNMRRMTNLSQSGDCHSIPPCIEPRSPCGLEPRSQITSWSFSANRVCPHSHGGHIVTKEAPLPPRYSLRFGSKTWWRATRELPACVWVSAYPHGSHTMASDPGLAS